MKICPFNSIWQVLFDILPLRLVPPLVFGGILYPLVGLVPTVSGFWKFLLTLVLFNLTTASVVLLLSIAFDSIDVASLVGTLVMLFKYVTFTNVRAKPRLIRLKLTFYWAINQSRNSPKIPSMAPHHLILPCRFWSTGCEWATISSAQASQSVLFLSPYSLCSLTNYVT